MGVAVDLALQYFDEVAPLIILSDSGFVYGALVDDTDVGEENIVEVEAMKVKLGIVSRNRDLRIYKVPGHAKIPGNNFADDAAGRAAVSGRRQVLRAYTADFRKLLLPLRYRLDDKLDHTVTWKVEENFVRAREHEVQGRVELKEVDFNRRIMGLPSPAEIVDHPN